MKIDKVTRNIEIEDLVNILPESVSYLMNEGIRCLRCGEPIWGNLEDAAKEKGFGEEEILKFEEELTKLLAENSK